jgi:hypothetical protein
MKTTEISGPRAQTPIETMKVSAGSPDVVKVKQEWVQSEKDMVETWCRSVEPRGLMTQTYCGTML